MTNTPSDRVQVRQIGDLMHPGACALCGSGNCDRGYVDLGIYYDYEGQVYLCMLCIEQIIETVGALSSDQSLHLQTLSEELAVENKKLEAELHDVRAELDSFYTVLASAAFKHNPNLFSQPSESDSAELSSEPADGAGGREPVAKKPTPKRRSHDSSQSKPSHTKQVL